VAPRRCRGAITSPRSSSASSRGRWTSRRTTPATRRFPIAFIRKPTRFAGKTKDFDPILRFLTLGFDPFVEEWLKLEDTSNRWIMAGAREFAKEHSKWQFPETSNDPTQDTLISRGWFEERRTSQMAARNSWSQSAGDDPRCMRLEWRFIICSN